MKRLLLTLAFFAFIAVANAQNTKGRHSFMASVGYQTEFQRFGFQAQGRYAICPYLRIAPDVSFYFPKDQITGLDINLNFHYVLPLKRVTLYPLAGLSFQTNFYANSYLVENEGAMDIMNDTGSHFAFNLGGGITYPLSDRCYLNAESKFMIGTKHNFTFGIGYGYLF